MTEPSITEESFNWEFFLLQLENHLNDKLSFESWIKPLEFNRCDGSILIINAPSKFIKDWVLKSFSTKIIEVLAINYPKIKDIEVLVSTFSKMEEVQAETTDLSISQKLDKASFNSFDTKFSYENLSIPLNEHYTFENFVVGKPNQFAYEAARRGARDANIQFNPLFLYGGVGLGKTHLMHSIAWEISKAGDRKFLYLTAEKFTSMYISSLQEHTTDSFREICRSPDVLMIDDFQFMGGKEATQEEFFNTFNDLFSRGKQIIISADKLPSELDRIEERITSRLNAGLSINIHATTYELRVGILESKAKIIGIKIPNDVIDFLAHTITSNVRELEGALKRVISYHQIVKVKIDLDMAMHVLEDVLKHKSKIINIESIQKKVSEHYKIKLADMSSPKKDKNTAHVRQIAMYIAKQITSSSLPEIGRKFGGRDHTTVMYAVNKISKEIMLNSNLEDEINLLIKIIQQG
ncbi:MAG: chromosomal replication initiator protein DnaA [Alphaproteobacteria bacterium]|jgi:chromosomal replication initiator protein|nr:chromosomal replication initiator protein DnaA [Alphaproteobacteria bacterium]